MTKPLTSTVLLILGLGLGSAAGYSYANYHPIDPEVSAWWAKQETTQVAIFKNPRHLMREVGWGDWEIRHEGDGYNLTVLQADETRIICVQYPTTGAQQDCFSLSDITER